MCAGQPAWRMCEGDSMRHALLKQEFGPSILGSLIFSFSFLRGFLCPDNVCFLKILKISPHPSYGMALAGDSGFDLRIAWEEAGFGRSQGKEVANG